VKIAFPIARAWVNSAKHHFDFSQSGLQTTITARDKRKRR
jgi:hypothetical protein